MVEKVPKAKAKAKPATNGVLGTLPASRPERLGRPRADGAQPKVAAAKPMAKRPTAKSGAKPRAAERHGPQAVRPGASNLRTPRPAEPPPKPLGAPKGTELVTTTIRAAGELAQIGFVVGGRMVKRAVRRLPKP